MTLKDISFCGHICHVILGLVMVIFASLTFSTNWWIVYFWDCLNDDFAYYIVLDEGLCEDSDQGQEGDYDNCVSWKDIADNDFLDSSDAQDDAQGYIDTNAICKTALSFVVILFCVLVLQLIPFISKLNFIRYIEAGVLVFCCILFMAAIGNSSNNYFTDVDNYYHEYCNSYATTPYTGYVSAIVCILFTGITAMSVLFPCCGCVDRTSDNNDQPMGSSSQARPAPRANEEQFATANPIVY
jgi:hypothetical protein